MAISNRSSADLKSFAIETLVAFERALSQAQKLSAQLAPFDDATVAGQLGVTLGEANQLKGSVAAIMAAIAGYDQTSLRLLLGVHPV